MRGLRPAAKMSIYGIHTLSEPLSACDVNPLNPFELEFADDIQYRVSAPALDVTTRAVGLEKSLSPPTWRALRVF